MARPAALDARETHHGALVCAITLADAPIPSTTNVPFFPFSQNVDHSAQIASLGRQATLHAQRETEIAQELKAAKDRVTELEGHLEQTRRERDEAKEAFKRSEERCVALEKAQAEEAARKIAK